MPMRPSAVWSLNQSQIPSHNRTLPITKDGYDEKEFLMGGGEKDRAWDADREKTVAYSFYIILFFFFFA